MYFKCHGRKPVGIYYRLELRREQLLINRADYNLLYRCFVGLSVNAMVSIVTTFTENRDSTK